MSHIVGISLIIHLLLQVFNNLFPNDLIDLTCYYSIVINNGSNVFISYYRSCLRKNLNQLQMKWH